MLRRLISALVLAALALPAFAQEQSPLVIAHRGASGERPEHTLAAYERALDQSADWLETDVVPTGDGVLVLRHEGELALTTDVAAHPEFADRKTTKTVDGEEFSGWFAEDFTLAELHTLRAKERIPDIRPANAAFDGLYPVATLAELLRLMRAKEAELGRPVSLLLEIKHPTYFAGLGHDLVDLTLRDLEAGGYGAGDPRIVIQSFEADVLCRLSEESAYATVQLVDPLTGPADRPGTSYRAMLAPEALPALKRCADGIGAHIALVLEPDGTPAPPSAARGAGMPVHAWTLRRENAFLPAQLKSGDDPNAPGDVETFVGLLVQAGVAGIITDNPLEVASALFAIEVGRAAAAAAEADTP